MPIVPQLGASTLAISVGVLVQVGALLLRQRLFQVGVQWPTRRLARREYRRASGRDGRCIRIQWASALSFSGGLSPWNSAVALDFESLSIRPLSCGTRSVPCSIRLESHKWSRWPCLSLREPSAHPPVWGVYKSSRPPSTSPLCSANSARRGLYSPEHDEQALTMQRFDTRMAPMLE